MWEDEENEEVEIPKDEAQPAESDVEKKVANENEVETESDNPLLEMTDDLEQLENLPVYNSDRAVSVSSLKPFTGFMCDLCDRTFESEELSQVFTDF